MVYTGETQENAKSLFDFFYVQDDASRNADMIIGFGHFDMRIPQLCGKLYQQGYAQRILFTGGRGAGSADLKEAEAVAFRKELLNTYHDLPDSDIIIESESTNTGENILFSERILENINPEYCFKKGIRKVIAVACPYRQMRVSLCVKKLFPEIDVQNIPPYTTFEYEMELYEKKNEDLIKLLAGEMERIMTYPTKGFIVPINIPDHVQKAYDAITRTISIQNKDAG